MCCATSEFKPLFSNDCVWGDSDLEATVRLLQVRGVGITIRDEEPKKGNPKPLTTHMGNGKEKEPLGPSLQLEKGIAMPPIPFIRKGIDPSLQNTKESFDKKIVNERIARLSCGIAILQVGAQTEVELKDKQLRIEDALNATKAALEEGVVVGGGCCLLRLSSKVDRIKQCLENEEQKIGADIFKRALTYPSRLIAKNAGVNGSVVIEEILSNNDESYGYNAATNCYEDLVAAGIIDPSKVVRCCIENAASVAKTFLMSDLVVVEGDTLDSFPMRKMMPSSGIGPIRPTSF